MRKIGLIGGMSWYSTEFYYRRINKQVQRRANAMCSAPMILDNLNFCDIARATTEQDWDRVGDVLVALGSPIALDRLETLLAAGPADGDGREPGA